MYVYNYIDIGRAARNVRNPPANNYAAHQPEPPYFALYGNMPELTLFEEFGCSAWVQTTAARRTPSLQSRAVKGIFLVLTLPLGFKSSYVLINSKEDVSTDVICLAPANTVLVSRLSDNMQAVPALPDLAYCYCAYAKYIK